jgi:hypothetical protein
MRTFAVYCLAVGILKVCVGTARAQIVILGPSNPAGWGVGAGVPRGISRASLLTAC